MPSHLNWLGQVIYKGLMIMKTDKKLYPYSVFLEQSSLTVEQRKWLSTRQLGFGSDYTVREIYGS